MSLGSQFGYPTPPSTRRSGQRSEEYTSSRGSFGISNVQFRAGAPPLRSLPLTTESNSQSLFISRNFGPEIDIAVYDILKKNGVIVNQERVYDIGDTDPTHTHWVICARIGNEMPYSEECTLLVFSPWEAAASDHWQNSVRDLKVWIDAFLDSKNTPEIDVHVEIIDKWLYSRKYTAPILDRPDLDRDWEMLIKPRVRNLLQSYEALKNEWTCIGLFSYGPSKYTEENPPTLYVSFDRDCSEISWAPFRHALQNFLESTNYGLRIHLEHAEPELLARFPLLTPRKRLQGDEVLLTPKIDYEMKVHMGADISASTYTKCGMPPTLTMHEVNSTFGTLGCYVQIQSKPKGPWETFILTNYHVVRPAFDGFKRDSQDRLVAPAPGTALYIADHGGFRHPTFGVSVPVPAVNPAAKPSAAMESPSRSRHNKNVAYLEFLFLNEKDKMKKKQWKQLGDTKKAFFDQGNHDLGVLVAGSGFSYRTKSNGMLDWALIKPKPGRVGLNALPAEADWDKSNTPLHVMPDGATFGAQLQHHVSNEKIFKNEHGFKYGATSGATCGAYGIHKHEVRYLDWKYMNLEANPAATTSEHSFMRLPNKVKHFGEPGDSGSVVWNRDGHALGLLFRGQTDPDSAMFTYVTPIVYVFDHIRSFLGVKIRVAEF